MIIKRHNYEEFFLLYVDNELNPEERAAVESFVSQNPDLAKELEVLHQITLAGDDIEFTQKELLYKKENGISPGNYEEYFLLFADGELNNKEAAEVENFVLKHPWLQDEFTLLQKVRLEPEPIQFAGKQKLYRKGNKERRIILLSLARMSVAAAIAGAVYISFIYYDDRDSNYVAEPPVAQSSAKKASEKINSSIAQKPVAEKTVASTPVKNKVKKNTDKTLMHNTELKKDFPEKINKTRKQEEAIAKNKLEEVKKETPVREKNLAIIEKPVPKQETLKAMADTRKVSDTSKLNVTKNKSREDSFIDQPLAKEEKPLITRAVYLETDDVEQEKTLYVGSAKINKNKVKGLFRKAAVFFDKKLRGEEN